MGTRWGPCESSGDAEPAENVKVHGRNTLAFADANSARTEAGTLKTSPNTEYRKSNATCFVGGTAQLDPRATHRGVPEVALHQRASDLLEPRVGSTNDDDVPEFRLVRVSTCAPR